MASGYIFLDGCKRGDTYEFDAVITRTASGVTLPWDLTGLAGAAIVFVVKAKQSDPDAGALITKQVGAGITITDAPAGKIHVKLSPADTADIEAPTILFWRIVATKTPDLWTAINGTIEIVNG